MTENFSTVILVFPQVTEVDKREPRESFLKPRPQAEAEKCSPRFPFVYWGNLEILKSDVDKFFRRQWQEQLLKQNVFFIFLAFSLPSLSKFIFKYAKFYSQKLLSSVGVCYKHLFIERGAAD